MKSERSIITRGIPISTKISLLIVIMVMLCSAFIGIFSYVVYMQDCKRYKRDKLASIAESVALMIDVGRFKEIVESGEKTDYFYEVQNFTEGAREQAGLEYLYVIVDNGDGENYRYIFDSDGEEGFGVLDLIEGYGADETFLTGETVTQEDHSEIYGSLLSGFTAIFDGNGGIVGVVGADIQIDDVIAEANSFGLKIAVAILLFNVVFLIIARAYTERTLGRPVKTLARLGESLARGEIGVKVEIKNKDEIGVLAEIFSNITDTLQTLIFSMEKMASEQSAGDNEAFIDVTPFKGAYFEVAQGVNGMVAEYVADTKDIISAVSAFGAGDFQTAERKFPGKKQSINTNLGNLRATFKELNTEISRLAESAANGDLSRKIEDGKFTGGWKTLVQALNSLQTAVEEPIMESVAVLKQMANGEFNGRVTGSYKGDFEIIKDALNSTQSEISSYIKEISEILNEISQKNLNVSIDRKYIGEFTLIKNSINMIIDTFNNVLGDMNVSAEQVAIGSKQISDSSLDLSRGASEQSNAVEELNATVSEVTGQAVKNADTASMVNQIMLDTRRNVEREASMMKNLLEAMEGIKEASFNISKIMKIIDDIAFQTNLLAINASVEAARVGEYGKAFSVVAGEVAILAERSQNAAKDTAALVEVSVKKASDGFLAAHETSKGLEVIVERISEAYDCITGIAASSKDQKDKIARINDEIVQISRVTQTNTAISEESAASSVELSYQAELFRDTVAKFILKEMHPNDFRRK